MMEYPRYIVDASLAGLAKWLRLLGYDTVVFCEKAGRKMMRIAVAEKRVILTRRQDMFERQFSGKMHLVSAKDTGGQLIEIITKLSLSLEKERFFSLCLKCNMKLIPASKEDVSGLVPPYVFANYSDYNQCPHCRKIYWPGTHNRNSLLFLKKLFINPA